MSWLALWLLAIAVTDLAHSWRPARHAPSVAGAATALAVGLSAGFDSVSAWVGAVIIAATAAAWGYAVTFGFGRDRAAVPLTLFGAVTVALVLLAAEAPSVGGAWAEWVEGTPLPVLADRDPDQVLLLLAVLAAQMSTGNVMVRLVLAATGTVNPVKGSAATRTLKGGRLLGPMERIVIVGLGVAGQVAAASVVIAAKGLLRWPEIQARKDAVDGPSIDDVTEYFLVGSFVSWLWALAGTALLV